MEHKISIPTASCWTPFSITERGPTLDLNLHASWSCVIAGPWGELNILYWKILEDSAKFHVQTFSLLHFLIGSLLGILFSPTHTWFRPSPPPFRSLPHVQSPAMPSLTTLCPFPAIFFSLALIFWQVIHFLVFTCFLFVLPTRSKLHEGKIVGFSSYQL